MVTAAAQATVMVAVTAAVMDTVAAAVVVVVTATVTGTVMATVVVPILGPIAASHTAMLAATSRPQTRRYSRHHCGLKHGVSRGNIAAPNTASIATPLRPQTPRHSRHRGLKHDVSRGNIAASNTASIVISSLPHRCLIAASNSASITAAIVAVGFPSAYVAVQVEPLSVFSQEAAGLVHAAGAAVKATSGHELDGCVFCVLICRGLDLQAQPFQAGRVGLE